MPKDASKLLEGMRNSKAKWKRKDLIALYEGHGFMIQSGGKHDKVWHPDYPQLVTFLPRHKKLAVSYVGDAIKIIDQFSRLRNEREGKEND